MSKSDLPVSRAKTLTWSKPATRAKQATIRFPARLCECGCTESYQPVRQAQRFITGHRFQAYDTHKCGECGVTHRVGRQWRRDNA